MISAEEKQALINSLVRLAKALDKVIEQKNVDHKQVLELIKGVLDQQHKIVDELRELKAKLN